LSEGGMTLRQVVQRLDSYNDELMIWARVQTKDDLTPDTQAVVAPARQDDSTWWEERGLSYVLEVDVAKEAIEVWRQDRDGAEPSAAERCAAVIHTTPSTTPSWRVDADRPAAGPEDGRARSGEDLPAD
jgi:hypothetical protein